MENLAELKIDSLDTPQFRLRIVRSNVYQHISTNVNLQHIRNFIVSHNQLCERLVNQLKFGTCINEIRARVWAIEERPRDDKNHNLNLKPTEKRFKPNNS